MKKEIKLERSLTPKDIMTPNSDSHLIIIRKVEKGDMLISLAQPSVQTEPKKKSPMDSPSYRLLGFS